MDRRHTLVIFLIVFANFLGATVVLPTLPLYAQRRFDMSPEVISALLASYFIAQFVAAPFIGRLSDRYGRIPVLMISQIGTVISFIMLGYAASIPMLFAARILDGITGGNVIVAQAYISDISPREKRTQSLGIVWMAFGLGYILGRAVGGFVAAIFSDKATFLLGAGISLLTTILTWLLLEESLTPERRQQRTAAGRPSMHWREIITNPVLVLLLLLAFGTQTALALMTSTLALFGEAVLFARQTAEQVNFGVGLLFTSVGVGQFLTQVFLLKPLVARYHERRLVFYGMLFRGLALLTMAILLSPLAAGAALFVFACASGVMMPSMQSLATVSVDAEHNGAVLGIYQSAVTLGIIAGTWLGGLFFAQAPTLPYLIGGVMLLALTLPSLVLIRRAQPVVAAA